MPNNASNKVTEVKGRAKEAVGKAGDNKDLEAEGKKDQVKAQGSRAVSTVKDAARDAKDAIKR